MTSLHRKENLSSSQFYKYLSLFSQVARRSLEGVPWAAPFFSEGIMHIVKKFAPHLWKKRSRPGGSPNSLRNNEHSAKALYFLSFSFLKFLSFSFSNFSFIFFHFLSLSCAQNLIFLGLNFVTISHFS